MPINLCIQILDKFQTTEERVSKKYVEKIESYITSRKFKEIIKEKLNLGADLKLQPLSGGITSVVYRTQGLEKEVVLKFSTQYNIFNDFNGLKVAYKNAIPVPEPIYAQKLDGDFCFSITEYINAPLLSEYLKENPKDLTAITQFGNVIRELNSIKGKGYGKIDGTSLKGRLDKNEDIREWFITRANKNYLIENDILSKEEVKNISESLMQYVYEDQGYLIHRDIRNENCLWNREPIIFDFNARYGDPLYDLANYRQKVLSRGLRNIWKAFFKGYGEDVDLNRLGLITGNILFNKAADWHKRKLESRHRWAVEFLKDKFN